MLGMPLTSCYSILIAALRGSYYLHSIDEEVEVRKNNFPKVTLGISGIYESETQLCVTPSPIVNLEQPSRESGLRSMLGTKQQQTFQPPFLLPGMEPPALYLPLELTK